MARAARVRGREIGIPDPCSRSWASLEPVPGDPNRRYCDDCGRHVQNLSALTRREAGALLESHQARGERGQPQFRPEPPSPVLRNLGLLTLGAASVLRPAAAQTPNEKPCTINVRVTDATTAPVPRVKVTAKNPSAMRDATTEAPGAKRLSTWSGASTM